MWFRYTYTVIRVSRYSPSIVPFLYHCEAYMTPERWQNIIQLFQEARDISNEIERKLYIATQCGNDTTLLAEVNILLTNENQSRNRLEEPILGTRLDLGITQAIDSASSDAETEIEIGTTIGLYQLIRNVGSGGMGIVYEAQQNQPQRRVAIKIMRHPSPSRQESHHFRREIEILGKLQHPNIAQVYDAGVYYTDSARNHDQIGRPYFVMELIPDARHIINYAQHHNLNIRQKLKLFCEGCQGVNHGHRKGIIHRDLKPENILIDTDGRPKIIDFGVARVAEIGQLNVTTVRTEIGLFVGTIQYMSPEQCEPVSESELLIDTRSDVYSLGIILYQLLCKQLPYDVSTSSVIKAARTVCDTTITRPYEIDRELKGDIDAIIIKSLNHNPDQRYQSAGELGEDIYRHLNGQPVIARPPSFVDQTINHIRRHPILSSSILSLLIAIVIIGSSIIGIWYYGKKPSYIFLDEDSSIAKLYSAGNNILQSWQHVHKANLYKRPAENGYDDIAFIQYQNSPYAAYPNRICLYQYGKMTQDTPILLHVPESRDYWPDFWPDIGIPENVDRYSSTHMLTQDIFPERPGAELVVIHSHVPLFPNAIRIYDLWGNVLYERWHKRCITQLAWDASRKLLVFASDRNDPFTHYDISDLPPNHLKTIFALRPDLNHQPGTTIIDKNQQLGEGVIWYRYMSPPSTWKLSIESITLDIGRERPAILSIAFLNTTPDIPIHQRRGFQMLIDGETGEVKSIIQADDYIPGFHGPDIAHIKLLPYPTEKRYLVEP